VDKYKTFGIAYETAEDEQKAEFTLFCAILPYIKTYKKKDGTFVKSLTADFPEVKIAEDGAPELILDVKPKLILH